jgi:hypothetical protein
MIAKSPGDTWWMVCSLNVSLNFDVTNLIVVALAFWVANTRK